MLTLSTSSKPLRVRLSKSITPTQVPDDANRGTTSSDLVVESHAMCLPGYSSTFGTKIGLALQNVSAQMPLLTSALIVWHAGNPWKGPSSKMFVDLL